MGPPDQAQHAADIISDLLRSVQAGGPPGHGGGRGRGRGQGNWNMGPPGGLQEFTFTVPTMKTGLIIGKGMWHSFFWFYLVFFYLMLQILKKTLSISQITCAQHVALVVFLAVCFVMLLGFQHLVLGLTGQMMSPHHNIYLFCHCKLERTNGTLIMKI